MGKQEKSRKTNWQIIRCLGNGSHVKSNDWKIAAVGGVKYAWQKNKNNALAAKWGL